MIYELFYYDFMYFFLNLQVMEYYVELEYWHKNGYFYEINSQFACPLMENLVTTFEGYFFLFVIDYLVFTTNEIIIINIIKAHPTQIFVKKVFVLYCMILKCELTPWF